MRCCDENKPTPCLISLPVLLSIMQIVLGSLFIVECNYNIIFSIVSVSLMIVSIIIYLIGYIFYGEDRFRQFYSKLFLGITISNLFIYTSVLTYCTMDVISILQVIDAPDTCPDRFKAFTILLAVWQIIIFLIMLIVYIIPWYNNL